jgi:hypothetical protein
MHKHHFKIGLISLLFLGLGTFYIVHYGFYPIAILNGEIVLAQDYYKVTNSGYIFYTNALATYQKVKLGEDESSKLYKDIAKASFDKLIEQKLINKEFDRRMGDVGRELVDKRLASIKNDNLEEPVAKLYGLSMLEFNKFILEPEAKRELLIADFKSQNDSFEAWLNNAKSKVNLRIFIPILR